MKKTHIIGLILIAVAIGIIMITTGDASTYVGFDEAESISQQDPNQKVHVVGTLKKDAAAILKEAEIIRERMQTLRDVEDHVGVYYSREWVIRNVLQMSDDEMD